MLADNGNLYAVTSALALFLTLTMLSLGFVGAAWLMALRVAPAAKRNTQLRWLIIWSAKGLVLPALLWAVMNLGISFKLQPFMPQVQAAQNSGTGWLAEFLYVTASGFFIVSSYWAAVTMGWAVAQAAVGLEDETRSRFKALCWTSGLGMFLPALAIVALGGWPTVGLAAAALLAPIVGWGPRVLGRDAKVTPPIYARAIARIKFGKYNEAEMAIIEQLEKYEDDFDGWMMLAELYANHFNDLQEAEQTVLGICEQPGTSPSQFSVALHRLADWQLKTGRDPKAARRSLQMICDRLPGTHLAHMAALRIRQLPNTPEELRKREQAAAIPLPVFERPPLVDPPWARHETAHPVATESILPLDKAIASANDCVQRLNQQPDDIAAREQLAHLFALHLGQPEQGIEQLELLLRMSGQPPAKRAEWLALIATWHLQHRGDQASARQSFERLVREFPETPQGIEARQRLLST